MLGPAGDLRGRVLSVPQMPRFGEGSSPNARTRVRTPPQLHLDGQPWELAGRHLNFITLFPPSGCVWSFHDKIWGREGAV